MFVRACGKDYLYSNGTETKYLHSDVLRMMFKTYGYCVDPTATNGMGLTSANIEKLRQLAVENNDTALVKAIGQIEHCRAPSPRRATDSIMVERTSSESVRYQQISPSERQHTADALYTLLHIGLHLGGWNGHGCSYPSSINPRSDNIRTSLMIHPLIRKLHHNNSYPLIKNFPIVSYRMSGELKPFVSDPGRTIDHVMDTLSPALPADVQLAASELITTAYYYLTVICSESLPMLKPLVASTV